MTRATSKASLLTTKEKGQDTAQQDRILEILADNVERSLQEIMAEYRSRFGNIELSSVSARCNKLKEEGRIRECPPRKCTISNRTVNPVTSNTCTHEHYKNGHYMTAAGAMKAMQKKETGICWMGSHITHCQHCGADISRHEIVEVKTAKEYMG